MQNDLYLAYRQEISKANWQFQMETMKVFQDLIQIIPTPAVEQKSDTVILLNQANKQEIFNNQFVVIDVYTDWRGPCKYLSPIIEELNQDYSSLYCFVKLNAEQEIELAKDCQIKGFPTILLLKDGQEIGRITGFMSKEKLLSKIKSYFD